MDHRVDVVPAHQRHKNGVELAQDVPDDPTVASRLEYHELEQCAFKAHTAAEQRVEAHAEEGETVDDECGEVEITEDNQQVQAARVIAISVIVGHVCEEG